MGRIIVMVEGLSPREGKTQSNFVAEALSASQHTELFPYGLSTITGEVHIDTPRIATDVRLVPEVNHEGFLEEKRDRFNIIVSSPSRSMVIYYAELYLKYGIPFVMAVERSYHNDIGGMAKRHGTSALCLLGMFAVPSDILVAVRFLSRHKEEKGRAFRMEDILQKVLPLD